ncbi:MAG: hypothetical protein EPO09_17415 [Aquabacterium sp.]|uniref:hypothetical protein n=1 Tax=Aquabacterium sp. TaxID=1872578 RepID=UPI00121A94A1|nr:hypothetical protein [Aquabacterium sp.]TAK89410.1 MAG: hypothetical protein EPO09_17415 [Aquabacterium sp.]
MGVLGQMYRLLTVAGAHEADKASDRRPLQLRLNDARRELDIALDAGRTDTAHLRLMVQEMERTFELRNTHARLLEGQDQEDAAMEIYETNVTDMFAGSVPYERLLQIYTHKKATKEAQRVARACLAHAAVDLDAATRALCLSTLQIPNEIDPE